MMQKEEAIAAMASSPIGRLKTVDRFRAIHPNPAFAATYNVAVFPLAVLKYEAGAITTFARHLNAASAKTKRAIRRRSHRISPWRECGIMPSNRAMLD